MDSLDNTDWDVLIIGTGLQQSLLALALSRSGKKILHIDENDYYGGAEAAFSLQEAEDWAERLNENPIAAAFSNISVSRPATTEADTTGQSLGPSRSYSLALSPQFVYARSSLLGHLVSSKVYRQLEFLAVGSWWVYSAEPAQTPDEASTTSQSNSRHGKLHKVPSGREDVFQDEVLDFKAKRALMKFLRFISEYEEQPEIWEEHRAKPFPTFLSEQFRVPTTLHAPLLALALSSARWQETTTEYALPRIARHLRSIGIFGAGFGSVISKWGGMSEITQVACRASAVGGGIYVLGKGLTGVHGEPGESVNGLRLRLDGGEFISTRWVVEEGSQAPAQNSACCRMIAIVSSPMAPLFPPITEDGPSPAAAVVFFPSGSLSFSEAIEDSGEQPPVYVSIHSSDTGESPTGQSVVYASTSLTGKTGLDLLKSAVHALLSSVDATPAPSVLWSLQYEQQSGLATSPLSALPSEQVLHLRPPALDLAFDDSVLDQVKEAWQTLMGADAGEFLVFEDREAYVDDD